MINLLISSSSRGALQDPILKNAIEGLRKDSPNNFRDMVQGAIQVKLSGLNVKPAARHVDFQEEHVSSEPVGANLLDMNFDLPATSIQAGEESLRSSTSTKESASTTTSRSDANLDATHYVALSSHETKREISEAQKMDDIKKQAT